MGEGGGKRSQQYEADRRRSFALLAPVREVGSRARAILLRAIALASSAASTACTRGGQRCKGCRAGAEAVGSGEDRIGKVLETAGRGNEEIGGTAARGGRTSTRCSRVGPHQTDHGCSAAGHVDIRSIYNNFSAATCTSTSVARQRRRRRRGCTAQETNRKYILYRSQDGG